MLNILVYLKVFQICIDVDDNIEVVDYKKVLLCFFFVKKGWIILFKVFVFFLIDFIFIWFIGIVLKNFIGSLKFIELKYVILKLLQLFDYSYVGFICILFFVFLLLGIVVLIVGLWFFKEYFFKVNILELFVKVNVSNRN